MQIVAIIFYLWVSLGVGTCLWMMKKVANLRAIRRRPTIASETQYLPPGFGVDKHV